MQFLVAWINCTKSTFLPPLATVLFTFLNKIESGNTNRRWLWLAQPTYTKRMLYSLLKETVAWVDQKRTCQKAVQGFKPLLQFITPKSNTHSTILHRPLSRCYLHAKIRKKKVILVLLGETSLYCSTFPRRLVRQKITELFVAAEHTDILSPCIWRKISIIFFVPPGSQKYMCTLSDIFRSTGRCPHVIGRVGQNFNVAMS